MVSASARTVHAQVQTLGPELIVNGDFSTGLGGWSHSVSTGSCAPGSLSGVGAACLVTYYTGVPAVVSVGGILQNVGTTIGDRYQVSFFAQARPFYFGPSVFSVYWGSTLLTTMSSGTGSGGFGFPGSTFSFFVDAVSASTTLRFENVLQDYCSGVSDPNGTCGEDAGSVVTLDDVSVRPLVTTPEPSTWALLGAGLAPLVVAARRRRS